MSNEGRHCNRLFLLKTYLTKKILRLSILKFWIYKYYVKCWVCHKTAFNILGLRQTQEFWSGSTQISFGSMYFGSDLDTPYGVPFLGITIRVFFHKVKVKVKPRFSASSAGIAEIAKR